MHQTRLMWKVIKRSGASKALTSFLCVYLICALVVLIAEPTITRYGDALWFLWAVSTTIGLGDISAITFVGRTASVLCSIYAIVTTAILTGVIVDYFSEVRQHQLDTSLTEFLDKLERLPELDKEELVQISERIKKFRK